MLRLQRAQWSTCCLLGLSWLGRPLPIDPPAIRLWLSRAMGGGPRTQPKKKRKPSRMVLSQKVAKQEKKKKKSALAPTDGLNQRVANMPGIVKFQRDQKQTTPRKGLRAQEQVKGREKLNFKHLKMARSLENISVRQKERAKTAIEEVYSFEDFKLLPSIQSGIKEYFKDLQTISPTPVQRLVIPTLLGAFQKGLASREEPFSAQFLIAAETGSGKTLAYLVPIVDHFKRDEEADKKAAETEMKKKSLDPSSLMPDPSEFAVKCRPKAIILVPTAELVSQVGAIAKHFSHVVKFRAALMSTHVSVKMIRIQLQNRPDIVISTPTLLLSIVRDGPYILNECKYIVIDEADSLFDRSFADDTKSIISHCQNLKLLVLCSATITRYLDNRLQKDFPDIKRLVTPNLHAIPRRVQLTIVDVDGQPYMSNKQLACADTLYNIAKEPTEQGFVKKVIVFVNERETTAELAEFLRKKGIEAIEYDRDTAGRGQSGALEWFTGPKVANSGHSEQGLSRKAQNMGVLVTTDIASRGIDTKTVKNIVLYDVPFSTIDFIHRLGRTGRMGRRGRAFILVDKTTNKAWVREVKTSMHMGSSLL